MALIATQSLSTAGTPPTFAAANASDTCNVGEHMALIVRNVSAGEIDVTLVTPGLLKTGDAYPDKVVVCAAGSGAGNIVPTEVWIPLGRDYADPSTGLATVTFEATSGISRAVVAL